MDIQEYYRQESVIKRIIEFLGCDTLDSATSVFIANGSVGESRRIVPLPVKKLNNLLENGCDIARSLWDSESLLIHFDIEYLNFDDPEEAFRNPFRMFNLQKPVIDNLLRILGNFGIRPLHLLSGRGHHLVWKINQNSTAFQKLAAISSLSKEVFLFYESNPVLSGIYLSALLAKAYAGIGMVIEFITDQLIIESQGNVCLPVTITDVEVVQSIQPRESISIDISEYTDPLTTRMIRVAFSVYSKAALLNSKKNGQLLYFIPTDESFSVDDVRTMRNPLFVAKIATNRSCVIPDFSVETNSLINWYTESRLAKYHRYYYDNNKFKSMHWNTDSVKEFSKKFPPCILQIITDSGRRLLKPAILKLVVRVLFADGWHPQNISEFITYKFKSGKEWGLEWEFYSPVTRSDFYVRALSGAIIMGADTLDDFDCSSVKQMGFCVSNSNCSALISYRSKLLNRSVHYE